MLPIAGDLASADLRFLSSRTVVVAG